MKLTLAAARVNKGLTQIEAAKLLGISPSALVSYEGGKTSPTVVKLEKIAKLYEVEKENLVLFKKEKTI